MNRSIRIIVVLGLTCLVGCQQPQTSLPKNAKLTHSWPVVYFENSLVDPVRYPQDPEGPFMVLFTADEYSRLKPYSLPGDQIQQFSDPDRAGDVRFLSISRGGRIVATLRFKNSSQGWHNFPPELIYNSASSRY